MSHYIECNTIAATQAFLGPLWYKEHLYAVTDNTTVGTLFRLGGHFLRRYYYNGFTGDYHRGIHPLKLIKWSFVATKFTPAINNSWQVENIWRWNFGIKSSAIVNVCLLRKDWAHYTTTMYICSESIMCTNNANHFALSCCRSELFVYFVWRDWCCSDTRFTFIELEATTLVTNFSSYSNIFYPGLRFFGLRLHLRCPCAPKFLTTW